MAINFTVSYTFSPSTTISSSEVNTNFSDEAAVWIGLEALTKTFAKLKVDVDPTTALEVATKQYVDHYSAWRRPVLQYASATTVAIESGLDGTSGNIPMLFPDGTVRTETSTTRTTFNITRNAVLTTSGAQSGLTGATSEAANTWYALYAVKVTDSSTLWVTVGSTVQPTQANYATLNTAYGTSGWVYLGMIRNGDQSGATGDILAFKQSGHITIFYNAVTTSQGVGPGVRLADSGGTASLAWSYAAGTSGATAPAHAGLLYLSAGGGVVNNISSSSTNVKYFALAAHTFSGMFWIVAGIDMAVTNNASDIASIMLSGWADNVLGVGSNPLL